MNPAYNKTLSLLVEIKDIPPHPPARSTTPSKQKPRTTAALREPQGTENRYIRSKMFGGAKAGWTGSTEPYIQGDPKPAKKGSFFKKMLGAFMRKFGRKKSK